MDYGVKTAAVAVVLGFVAGCSAPEPRAPEERAFHFEYTVDVKEIPADVTTVRIWIPLPRSDATQEISNLQVISPIPFKETRERLYGNRLAYFETRNPVSGEIPVKISFDVKRLEVAEVAQDVSPELRSRLLRGDRLAPLNGPVPVAERTALATAGLTTAIEKARGIYDKVLADVDYDKTGKGWGEGDLAYVCEAGKGNCSDFHALFISMARSAGIPAVFEIGFPIPSGQREGTVGGYHCWAWYEDRAGAWRPVDASEADKDASRKDYFFGTLCCNRVAFSRGRDLILEPPQAGEPVNFLIYPHVELDGKVGLAKVSRSFSFREADKASS
jgi:transglutaminase-like putative cysteine protease